MATLPQVKRLNVEDFSSQQSWIGKLFLVLNTFMDGVTNALNNSLTLGANTTSQISSLTVNAIPSVSTPLKPAWKGKTSPSGVIVIQCIPTNLSFVAQTSPTGIQWIYDAKNGLQITNLIGVTPTNSLPYTLTLLIVGG
jgi:hypothetical protein